MKSALLKTLITLAGLLGISNFAYAQQCSLPPANEGQLSFQEPTSAGAPVTVSWQMLDVGYGSKVASMSLYVSGTTVNGRPISYTLTNDSPPIVTNGYSIYVSGMPTSGYMLIVMPPGTYSFELYGNFAQTGSGCNYQSPQYEEAEATYTVQ
jgi:hypothetical protein